MSRSNSVKIGRIGEDMARIYFRQNGWVMYRVQPETRVIMIKGKPVVVPVKSNSFEDGIVDFIGYRYIKYMDHCNKDSIIPTIKAVIHIDVPTYTVCEVKAVHGKSCPLSKFERQHKFLMNQPEGSRFVFIWWIDYNKGTMHKYRGEGIKYTE